MKEYILKIFFFGLIKYYPRGTETRGFPEPQDGSLPGVKAQGAPGGGDMQSVAGILPRHHSRNSDEKLFGCNISVGADSGNAAVVLQNASDADTCLLSHLSSHSQAYYDKTDM